MAFQDLSFDSDNKDDTIVKAPPKKDLEQNLKSFKIDQLKIDEILNRNLPFAQVLDDSSQGESQFQKSNFKRFDQQDVQKYHIENEEIRAYLRSLTNRLNLNKTQNNKDQQIQQYSQITPSKSILQSSARKKSNKQENLVQSNFQDIEQLLLQAQTPIKNPVQQTSIIQHSKFKQESSINHSRDISIQSQLININEILEQNRKNIEDNSDFQKQNQFQYMYDEFVRNNTDFEKLDSIFKKFENSINNQQVKKNYHSQKLIQLMQKKIDIVKENLKIDQSNNFSNIQIKNSFLTQNNSNMIRISKNDKQENSLSVERKLNF